MLWDVFCRVIDNFGDIGVCWRLAADLGQRGQQVRLWTDDASALTWMAPDVAWRTDNATGLPCGLGQPGVQVMHWADAQREVGALPGLVAGDVVVEAFGCDPPDAFVARMASKAAQGAAVQWINLEYLSAEDYVARSHGLRSPVWSGPGAGLSKRFFYPGFTPDTGGLLREPDLLGRRAAEVGSAQARASFLSSIGVDLAAGAPIVLVFCYDSAPLADLLDRLDLSNAPQVLLAPGPATRLGRAWQQAHPDSGLCIHALPALPQADFDRLLWCTDLNFVRGEDSAVRALWAGRPHVWQIYEQDDGVHARKLDAFMQRWMARWPAELRRDVHAWWLAWNRLGPMPASLPPWQGPLGPWRQASERARADLAVQEDLCSRLLEFASGSG